MSVRWLVHALAPGVPRVLWIAVHSVSRRGSPIHAFFNIRTVLQLLGRGGQTPLSTSVFSTHTVRRRGERPPGEGAGRLRRLHGGPRPWMCWEFSVTTGNS